jgi:hypothetical protein
LDIQQNGYRMKQAYSTNIAEKILSNLGMFILMSVILIPVIWPYMGRLEGKLLPVITDLIIDKPTVKMTKKGLEFYAGFYKHRTCGHVETSWYNKNNERIGYSFEPTPGSTSTTLEIGPNYVGPGWLTQVDSFCDVRSATVKNSCHPLWDTVTVYFPNKDQKFKNC